MENVRIFRPITKAASPSIRFDRNELAGAFGDIGTDLPLVVGVALAANLDGASVLTMFGLMQILTGLRYRMPMPVQPLKAVAAIVIAQKVGGSVLYGAGLAIGVTMLLLSVSGVVDWLARIVPKSVVRGVQFGLGLQLAMLALKEYVQSDGGAGYWLAAVAFIFAVIFLGNRRYPAALFLVLVGLVYAFAFKLQAPSLLQGIGLGLPKVHIPQWQDILTGFFLLALPQIPLSLGNSILATRQIAEDLFPDRPLTVRQLSFTYALMNLVNPFFGGIPTCHGSGGMAGHYAFGARTGGSVIIEGALYVLLGLFFGRGFETVIKVFPLPILGVILLFEGLTLMRLVRDLSSRGDLTVSLLVGLLAVGLPYGYLIGMVIGVATAHLMQHDVITLGTREL
ncbi:MAG: putative sulfate/molybdate transporter [Anaerolineae bacterium]|nr:putative sulfate/molybdate transporter [Anaerolineae bacterium]MDW8099741.1 putative sulfate/molybdate transporter [Anaerolineae bacterium]